MATTKRRRLSSPHGVRDENATYDREADIFITELRAAAVDHSVEHVWGLVDVADDGRAAGVEIWDASARLPHEMLRATPEPFTGPSEETYGGAIVRLSTSTPAGKLILSRPYPGVRSRVTNSLRR